MERKNLRGYIDGNRIKVTPLRKGKELFCADGDAVYWIEDVGKKMTQGTVKVDEDNCLKIRISQSKERNLSPSLYKRLMILNMETLERDAY